MDVHRAVRIRSQVIMTLPVQDFVCDLDEEVMLRTAAHMIYLFIKHPNSVVLRLAFVNNLFVSPQHDQCLNAVCGYFVHLSRNESNRKATSGSFEYAYPHMYVTWHVARHKNRGDERSPEVKNFKITNEQHMGEFAGLLNNMFELMNDLSDV